jgi:L-2,4-diaminobutyrate decarboxylase
VLVCGEHAHYAVRRAAGAMGLGVAHVVSVPSRAAHDTRMDVRRSPHARRPGGVGARVLAVVRHRPARRRRARSTTSRRSPTRAPRTTRGCTWTARTARPALLADAHRHRVRGIGRAHSVAWDPHKMLLLPLACGAVLVREERWLEAAFAQAAPYLFHAPDDGEARVVDQGIRSFQCSRRADALKLWVAFQRYGADGLGALYAHLCDAAARLHARLAAHPRFAPLHAPASNILCFRWTGDDAVGLADDALDALQPRVRARYNASGAGWITVTTLGGRRVLRVTLMNPRTADAHLDALVAGLDAVALDECARRERAAAG